MNVLFGRRRPKIPESAKKNIASITQIEQQFLRQRTLVDRVSDAIARFAGSVRFVIAHVVGFSAWIVINSGLIPGIAVFDPVPFSFLNLAVGLEAIFLSTFVLMSENRQSRQTDQWSHLDLQISLLAEQEATKMLQMLQAIATHLGLENAAGDKELKEMLEQTHVPTLAQELAKAREPEETKPPQDSGGQEAAGRSPCG